VVSPETALNIADRSYDTSDETDLKPQHEVVVEKDIARGRSFEELQQGSCFRLNALSGYFPQPREIDKPSVTDSQASIIFELRQ